VADPLHVRQQPVAGRDPRRQAGGLHRARGRRCPRPRDGRPDPGLEHARRSGRLDPRQRVGAARLRDPLRGLVAAPVQARQGGQRADLVGRQPDPRDPLRGQHVGALDRLEGLPLPGRPGGRG
jgi:hypothetical protein